MSTSRETSDSFVRESMYKIAREKIILDVGGGERFTKWMNEYRSLFENLDYRTFDYDASTGADIVGDIHAMPIEDAAVDAIICSSVLEHVRNPLLAMSELTRILKPGGKMFFYMPSLYPYHARKGHYPDLWRCFEDTVHQLFEGYSEITIRKRGGYFFALSFFIPKQHKLRRILNPVTGFLDKVMRTEQRSSTAGYYVYAIK